MKEISIVIPTYKRSSSVRDLLKSVDEQVYDFNKLEMIVVSNFEDAELENSINSMDLQNIEVQLLIASKQGANASRNLGIKKSTAEIIYLLDDDCRLNKNNFLNELVSLHKKHKNAGVIGGGYEVSLCASVEERAYNLISKEWQYIHKLGSLTSTRLVGGNVSYKRSVFENHNEFFDESIYYGGSESEFHKRLFKKNIEMMYFPNLTVLHESRVDENDIINKARKQAITHSQFDIDGGGYIEQKKTYQDNLSVWALKASKNNKEYRRIIELMSLYNWVYHSVLKKPKISLLKLRWDRVVFMNKRRSEAGRL